MFNPGKYFEDNYDAIMSRFSGVCNFTEPINTANSIGGVISNISFSEKIIINELQPFGGITKISCKFGEVRSSDYVERKPLSNRGRKRSVRKNEYRKRIGTHRSFQSQLTFVIKRIYSGKVKEYKFLLFVNGNFTLTGVPSDITGVMDDIVPELLDFMKPRFPEIRLDHYKITMRNYKFHTNHFRSMIDDMKLDKFISEFYNDCVLISFQEIIDFMCYPVFDCNSSPHKLNKWAVDTRITSIDNTAVSKHFKPTKHNKTTPLLRIKLTALCKLVNGYNYTLFNELQRYFNIITRERINVDLILKILLLDYIDGIYMDIYYNMENLVRQYSYDTEKFQGFTIKLLTPIEGKPNKMSTINIFRSGKVNLQGSPNDKYCRYVMLLLSDMLYGNDLTYNFDETMENMTDEEILYA
jgi:hypothetical protein